MIDPQDLNFSALKFCCEKNAFNKLIIGQYLQKLNAQNRNENKTDKKFQAENTKIES